MNQCTDTLSSWPVFFTSLLAVEIYRHALTLARASCFFFFFFFCFLIILFSVINAVFFLLLL